ncbi:MAG TPA: autotransporter domain-containing protein [Stenotrophomonas sp.]|nr:autotransporter domain-containing protein [Stenotrophomonas sp.]
MPTLPVLELRPSRLCKLQPLTLATALVLSSAACAQAAPGALGAPDSWVTPEFRANQALGMIQAQYAYARGLNGRNIWLGVTDSGVMFDHPELAAVHKQSILVADPLPGGGRCAASPTVTEDACFHATGHSTQVVYQDVPDNIDEATRQTLIENDVRPGASYESHGTAVASQALARRDGTGMHGVAFGANLASARVQAHKYMDLAAAADLPNGITVSQENAPGSWKPAYADMAARGVRVINNSWDVAAIDPKDAEDPEQAQRAAQTREREKDAWAGAARVHGMIQVFAAGNDSAKPPGEGALLPATRPDVERLWLAVANLQSTSTMHSDSTRCGAAAQWCLSAPGTQLLSAEIDPQRSKASATPIRDAAGKVTGLQVEEGIQVGGHSAKTGTSFATPVVTGALAVLMERYPYLDNAQVRDVMLTTATDLGAPGVDPVFGWGALNLRKAIDGPGQLRVDTQVTMNQRAGGAKVWQGEAWDEWRNDIGGPGRLGKDGQGWLRLAGNNTFAGADVRGGMLELTGSNALTGALNVHTGGQLLVAKGALMSVPALTVHSGRARIDGQVSGGSTSVEADGVLEGTGQLGSTRVAGVISPGVEGGARIGQLRVDGDYTHLASALYRVDLAANGDADMLAVSGKARIEGGRIAVTATPSIEQLGQSFTVLTAAKGIEGQFTLPASPSTFLAFVAGYTPTSASLMLGRGLPLGSAAATANQRAVAAAADAQDNRQPLLGSMLTLSPQGARQAFDQLSGEVHASTRALLLESSRIPRETLLARARRSGQASADANSHAPRQGLWARADHQSDRLDGNGNAAAARFDGNVLLAGYDLQLDSGWTLGAMLGHGKGETKVADRQSKARVRANHIGVYAGQHWGPWGLGAGYVHSRQQVKSQRSVTMPGLQETLVAKYDTRTDQAFVEGTYRWSNGQVALEPFLQYTYLRQGKTGVAETGGLAALSGGSPAQDLHLGTAGLRWEAALGGPNPGALSLRGQLAYQQASREFTPTLAAKWSGADTFQISGAPLARNATLVGVSLLARPSRNTELEFGYGGAFSRRSRDGSINGRFEWKF